MKQIFDFKNDAGWIYYIDSAFAWVPLYCQGSFVWLRRYWMTWPELNGKPVMASDVLSKEDMASMNGRDEQMYLSFYPCDPRKSK